ncbi:MAG: DNA mismatch repair endonuclease MutL [Oscillibacter sp.]|uniref:DNA mismatch repair endonuclease MutL n=1 Tax=Oscillibacter sp. TaxID=1945593 RepID=UPI00216DBC02|nr:DNA mismatch repair endonuclease MutL [Oscillibacter sp.]MCI8841306.1 DNA mismatch repair endonuclease MutL [Oscillibacter sp.]MCI9113872.1 DNA mismatch repair endonuclease MutL [Oscillibacter sp.]
MPSIQQLPPHVADLIAAGEVVERPASVVKELVENALDAHSSAVVVELRRGGMGLIRVTDNGCGIAPTELPTAFLRHATSKLRGAEDLGKIGTLGFRGEALAAISAVSRVEIQTRRREDPAGAALRLEGGVPGAVEEAGAPEGTTILVRDLFYNTPARLKFMKKDSAETAAAGGLMQHLALSHPDVSFKFIKDGAEALHTPGDGRLDSAIYAALGRDFARSLLPVKGGGDGVTVSGFITRPLQGRGSRGMQVFFVNGRFIKSQLLTAALEEGYRNQIMKGRFPGCVLAVTLPVTAVDVNVHPAKTQIKFAQEQAVFNAVYHTVLDALAEQGGPVPAAPAEPEKTVNPRGDFFQSMNAKAYREQGAKPAAPAPRPSAPLPAWDTERTGPRLSDSAPPLSPRPALGRSGAFPPLRQDAPPSVLGPKAERAEAPPAVPAEPKALAKPTLSKEPVLPEPRPFVPAIPQAELPGQEALEPPGEAPWRIAGELLRTYIVCESEAGEVWLVDKHAAHERVNFDRLKAALEPPMRQALLTPAAVELGKEDGALLLEHLPLLEDLGFSCEDFGGGAVLVREIPADLDAEDVTATLEEIAGKLRSGRSLAERREGLLHTMACKAAIKGGWKSGPEELRALIDKVQSGEVRYCPHGRPVAVRLTKYELEKMFKRS